MRTTEDRRATRDAVDWLRGCLGREVESELTKPEEPLPHTYLDFLRAVPGRDG
jgi:hypothetical protein